MVEENCKTGQSGKPVALLDIQVIQLLRSLINHFVFFMLSAKVMQTIEYFKISI